MENYWIVVVQIVSSHIHSNLHDDVMVLLLLLPLLSSMM